MTGENNTVMKIVANAFVLVSLFTWTSIGSAEIVDRIVAIVNDDAITLSELEEELAPYVQEIRYSMRNPEEQKRILFRIRQDILKRMIETKLTDQESKRLGIHVSDAELEQRIEQIKNQNFLTDETLREQVDAQGITFEEFKEQVMIQILRFKIINREVKSKIAVTEAEIREYYEKNRDEYATKKRYRIRTILVKVPSWQSRDDETAAVRKIEVIMDALQHASFDEVARQFSEDMSAKDGGDLGFFTTDELIPELQETVGWMKEGEISPALKTPQGYQILYVEKIEGSQGKSLEQAKANIQDKIFQKMVEEQYMDWVEALKKRAFIKVIQ